MHNKRIMLLALGVSGIACGQQPKQNRPSLPPVEGIIPGGSIAGKPIPDHVFAGTTLENAKLHVAMNQNRPLNSKTEAEAKADMVKSVCLRLNGIIYDAAEKRAITDLGITVTREDIATARASIKSDPVASSNWLIERAKLMISALTAVDQGQDAHQLYALMLQPKGIMEAKWELYRMQWKNPQGRARLEQQLLMTPDVIAKGIAISDLEGTAKRMATHHNLLVTIDQRLAAQDPVLKGYLDRNPQVLGYEGPNHKWTGPGTPTGSAYLENKRYEWWQAQEAKASVLLNDPTLARTCNLATR